MTTGGHGCFIEDGDWFSIFDSTSDGHSVIDGAGKERFLNKDFSEDRVVEFKICLGKWSTKGILSNNG